MAALINIAQFQVGWFASVLNAASGRAWLGALIVAALLVCHLSREAQPSRETALLAGAGVFGFAADTVLVQLGGLTFAGAADSSPQVAPYWMAVMWMNFAATLNHSLAWLQDRLALAFVLGAFAGPLAYFAGERLGALNVAHPDVTYVGAGVLWAIALPVLLWTARRLRAQGAHAATA